MTDQTSAELTGWLAYLSVDDEVQMQRMAYAAVKAFGGGQRQPDEEEEPVIDTTDPTFVEQFQGFIGKPEGRQPQRMMPNKGMQILRG